MHQYKRHFMLYMTTTACTKHFFYFWHSLVLPRVLLVSPDCYNYRHVRETASQARNERNITIVCFLTFTWNFVFWSKSVMNGESLDYSQRLVGLRLRFGKQLLICWLVYTNCLFLFMFCLMFFHISRHVRQYSRSLTICCLSLPREQRYVVVYNHLYFCSAI